MQWVLAVFGKAGSPLVAGEVEKYVKRLRGGAIPLEVVELKESKLDDRKQSLAAEASLFEKKFPKNEYKRIILSEEGKLMDTVKLSETLQNRFAGNVVFLIGSAYGIDENLKKSADLLLSLSPLTFTHDHARILMAEQLYRVQMVMQGHPYHHK
ncbi:MAG: 23S rRNA (pseudouridine(1915)-N(3))-methyltransferase RlmH [Fibrobacter sp.]|nr:23S rRNA (pseudouridine(1915)-N(3))-methyltransferase RlmH [Fibrobacter sp.]